MPKILFEWGRDWVIRVPHSEPPHEGERECSSSHDDVPDTRVVLDAQVDVLLDAKAKVARGREVALLELVLLDLEAALEDLLGLGAADRHVDGNLLVAADAKVADRVARLGRDGRLTRQLLQDLGGPREPVTTLTNRDVCA